MDGDANVGTRRVNQATGCRRLEEQGGYGVGFRVLQDDDGTLLSILLKMSTRSFVVEKY